MTLTVRPETDPVAIADWFEPNNWYLTLGDSLTQ
jgi:hypothetical protein